MLNGVQVTEQASEFGQIILRIFEGDFVGCEYYYDKVTFADKPNSDGTYNLNFEYTITNGYEIPKGRKVDFEMFLGENLANVIHDSLETNSAVYHGGEGGVLVE